jgi:phosphoglycerate dehydrogenase-like enzyme
LKVVISRPSSLEPLGPLYAADHDVHILRQPTDYGRAPFTEGELMEYLKDAEVFIPGQDRMTRNIMEQAERLKLVIGTDKIDKVVAFGRGEIPEHVVNPEVLPHRRMD